MTSDATPGAVYSLLDDSPGSRQPCLRDWESHALGRVAEHVRELNEGQGAGRATRSWESQAVERLARYLRTGSR